MSKPTTARALSTQADDVIARICSEVTTITGVQLGEKQSHMVESRLQKRMHELGLREWDEYFDYFEAHAKDEIEKLISILTTHHTFFFREFSHFEYLEKTFLPGILPEIQVEIEKKGAGSLKGSDQIRIKVVDNGPGIEAEDVTKVYGEYLASSKFGRGKCSRGQQGIGISAATTWAQLTNAAGARVITKTKGMRKALSCIVEVDIKSNKGMLKSKEMIEWDRPHGTSVEFFFDGRLQMNGEAGLYSYLTGTTLVNPHLTLHYTVPDSEKVSVERVSTVIPEIPEAVEPHPHTMKLGEFIAHSHLFGRVKVNAWLKKSFSRVNEGTLKD
ncbi:MAG: hypothetical protein EOP09_07145, partial [Proteobacteria bacterium]